MHEVGFTLRITCFAVICSYACTAPLYLVGVIIFMLLIAKIFTQFINLHGEIHALIYEFAFAHLHKSKIFILKSKIFSVSLLSVD